MPKPKAWLAGRRGAGAGFMAGALIALVAILDSVFTLHSLRIPLLRSCGLLVGAMLHAGAAQSQERSLPSGAGA
jgi:hypothetical protein